MTSAAATERTAPAASTVELRNSGGRSDIVLVCEHASALIPDDLAGLGLAEADRLSHAVWDPGAVAVARHLSDRLDAVLVAGGVSRLVYDCNRPPEAPDAMPSRSEVIVVPGNAGLDPAARAGRATLYYAPFRTALARAIAARAAPVLVTIHSFTPVFHGRTREVELGLLHDTDDRLARAMLARAPAGFETRLNDPYGPEHGVTHTLREHAIPGGHPNVMIEIRNDLIATAAQQAAMAETFAPWIAAALAEVRHA